MFFRKRVRVKDFLERRIGDLFDDDGTFTLDGFFQEYQDMLAVPGNAQALSKRDVSGIPSADHDLFTNHLIGTFIWLIKYRTLSNQISSPRKTAYLDLTFDTVAPEVVDKLLSAYNINLIKEIYDTIDIGCKKAFTGELLKTDKPRFLVSPLWARNPDPHPFRIAARLFVENVRHGSLTGASEDPTLDLLCEALEKRFISMTDQTADFARRVNLI